LSGRTTTGELGNTQRFLDFVIALALFLNGFQSLPAGRPAYAYLVMNVRQDLKVSKNRHLNQDRC